MTDKQSTTTITVEAYCDTMGALLDSSSVAKVIQSELVAQIQELPCNADTENVIDILNGVSATAGMLADSLYKAHGVLDNGTRSIDKAEV